MQDMTGIQVYIDDYLLDERGHMHMARETSPLIQANAVIYTYEISLSRGKLVAGRESFLRQGFCLKVDPEWLLTSIPANRKAIWDGAFSQYRAAELKADNAFRRSQINIAREKRLAGKLT